MYLGLRMCVIALLMCSFAASVKAEVHLKPTQHLINQVFQIPAYRCQEVQMLLQKGAELYGGYDVQGAVDNRIGIEMLDEWNRNLRSAGQAYQHFTAMSGDINGTATLKFQAPSEGNYFAEFCNDKALLLDRIVHVDLYTTRNTLTPEEEQARVASQKAVEMFREHFSLPEFDVNVVPCGVVNAFSDPNVTICNEIIESFPKAQAAQLFNFVLFHELGHTTLKLWGLPGWDNEDMADEFASSLLLMGNDRDTVLTAANWWLTQSSNIMAEALSKIGIDDRHSLSSQRARNIHGWAEDDGKLVQRWMVLFAPHLSRSALVDSLKDKRFENNPVLKQELARRDHDGGSSDQVVGSAANVAPRESPQAVTSSITDRLRDLKMAHDTGLLTDDEYKLKRAKILQE